MEILKLNQAGIFDFVELITIFNEAFENINSIPGKEYLTNLLSNPDFFVVVAKEGNEVIEGLTAFVLHSYYTEKPVSYIYDVGVKPAHQRKGVGKSLISFLNNYCKQNGFQDAYVEAEADDIDAVSFYRKTNFSTEMKATQFIYNFQ